LQQLQKQGINKCFTKEEYQACASTQAEKDWGPRRHKHKVASVAKSSTIISEKFGPGTTHHTHGSNEKSSQLLGQTKEQFLTWVHHRVDDIRSTDSLNQVGSSIMQYL
jgi:hypothetical protein